MTRSALLGRRRCCLGSAGRVCGQGLGPPAAARAAAAAVAVALISASLAAAPSHAAPSHAPPAAPAASGAAPPATGASRKSAEALFDRYVDLEHAFDPALVDLYADEARIEHRLIVAGQRPIVRTWSGKQYKDLLRGALAKAKETRQDLNYYTAVDYLQQGSRVRIKAMRYAELQKVVSPLELLVGPDRSGAWRIYEERGENHPRPTRPVSAAPPPAAKPPAKPPSP